MRSDMGRVGVVVLLVFGAVFSSCGSSSKQDESGDGGGGDPGTCQTPSDCPNGFVCVLGNCVEPGPSGGTGGAGSGGTNPGTGGDAGRGPSAGEGGDGATGGTAQGGNGAEAGTGATAGDAGGDQGGSGQGGSGTVCPGGERTTLSGVVRDPTGTMPLYNALVYVPSDELDALPATVSCDRCYSLVSGSPVSVGLTDAAGRFTLNDVPSGSNVRLVVQLGKWRRVVTLPPITACASNTIDDPNLTRLPRDRSEGDLPRIAVTTGQADAFECLLLKMGISVDEFTADTGNGRVHLYAGGDSSGEGRGTDRLQSGQLFSDASTLWASPAKLANYDLLLMSCEGGQLADAKAPFLANIENYMGVGGHVLLGHLQFYWLNHGSKALQATADYTGVGEDLPEPTTATIDTSFPKGAALADWLVGIGASATRGELTLYQGQHSVSGVVPPTARWIYATNPNGDNPTSIQHLTFNAPPDEPLSSQCGRVAFTDMHVSGMTGDSSSPDEPFPTGCTGTWTPQARALAFLVYDLARCVADDAAAPMGP